MAKLHLDRSSYRLLTALAMVTMLVVGGAVAYKKGGVGADTLTGTCKAASTSREIQAAVTFLPSSPNMAFATVTLKDDKGIQVGTPQVARQAQNSPVRFNYPFANNVIYRISAEASDQGSLSETKSITFTAGGKNSQQVDLVLKPVYRLSGQAVFVDQSKNERPVTSGSVEVTPSKDTLPSVKSASIDSLGKFSDIRLMEGQDYSVVASANNQKGTSQTVKLTGDKTDLKLVIDEKTATSGGTISGKVLGIKNATGYGVRFVPATGSVASSKSISIADSSNNYSSLLEAGTWYVRAGNMSNNSRWEKVVITAGQETRQNLEVNPLIAVGAKRVVYAGKTITAGTVMTIYESVETADQNNVALSVGAIPLDGKSTIQLRPGKYVARGDLIVNGQPKRLETTFDVPGNATSPYFIPTITLTDRKLSIGPLQQIRSLFNKLDVIVGWIGRAKAQAPESCPTPQKALSATLEINESLTGAKDKNTITRTGSGSRTVNGQTTSCLYKANSANCVITSPSDKVGANQHLDPFKDFTFLPQDFKTAYEQVYMKLPGFFSVSQPGEGFSSVMSSTSGKFLPASVTIFNSIIPKVNDDSDFTGELFKITDYLGSINVPFKVIDTSTREKFIRALNDTENGTVLLHIGHGSEDGLTTDYDASNKAGTTISWPYINSKLREKNIPLFASDSCFAGQAPSTLAGTIVGSLIEGQGQETVGESGGSVGSLFGIGTRPFLLTSNDFVDLIKSEIGCKIK